MVNISSNRATLRLVISGEVQQDIGFPLPVDGEVTLGREPSCDIPLDTYTSVSRRHAVIRPLRGEWVIDDLNSANGTFVNGQKIQGERVLKPGDKIHLALDGAEFLFEYEQIAAVPQGITNNIIYLKQEQETIKEKHFRIQISTTQLSIQRSPHQILSFWEWFIVAFMLITSSFMFLPFLFFWLLIPKWVDCTFDLTTGYLTISYQEIISWLFGFYWRRKYCLNEFTAVRLNESHYQGDEGTNYYNYDIYLERENSKALKLPITWRNDKEKAKQLVDLIEKYLQQVEGQ